MQLSIAEARPIRTARSQHSEALRLPDRPAELIAAENAQMEITANLATTRADLETLCQNFNVVNLRRADGELFPNSGREATLSALASRQSALEAARDKARRALEDARRAFGESVAQQFKPAIDEICESAIESLDAAELLVRQLEAFAAEARRAGIHVRHSQLDRAAVLSKRLYELRGELVPTPTIGARR